MDGELRKYLGYFRVLLRDFHPAVHALDLLMRKVTISAADCSVLAEALLKLTTLLQPAEGAARVAPEKLLEQYVRQILALLASHSEERHAACHPANPLSLTCSLTFHPLTDPVMVPGTDKLCNRAAILPWLPGGDKYAADNPRYWGATAASLVTHAVAAHLVHAYPRLDECVVFAGWPATHVPSAHLPSLAYAPAVLAKSLGALHSIALIPALSLGSKSSVMTHNVDGTVCVATGPAPCSSDNAVNLFLPLTGGMKSIAPHALASAVAKLKLAATSDAELLQSMAQSREPPEGIVIVLDISTSMTGASDFQDEKTDQAVFEQDEKERLQQLRTRITASKAEMNWKNLTDDDEAGLSIGVRAHLDILRNDPQLKNWRSLCEQWSVERPKLCDARARAVEFLFCHRGP